MAAKTSDFDCNEGKADGQFPNGDKFTLQTFYLFTNEDVHKTNAISVMTFADGKIGESYKITSYNQGLVAVPESGEVFLIHNDHYTFEKDGVKYDVDNLANHVVRIAEPANEAVPASEGEHTPDAAPATTEAAPADKEAST